MRTRQPRTVSLLALLPLLVVPSCKRSTTTVIPEATIAALFPEDDAQQVGGCTLIRVTFEDELDTLPADAVTVEGGNGKIAATITLSSDKKSIVLKPAQPLAADTVHVAELATSVRTANGAQPPDTAWSFRTEKALTVAVSPADKTRNVDPSGSVVLTFSGAVDPADLAQKLRLLADGRALPIAIDVAGDEVTVTLDPNGRLPLLAKVDVQVDTAVQTKNGTKLSKALATSFTVREGKLAGASQLDSGSNGNVREAFSAAGPDGTQLVAWVQTNDNPGVWSWVYLPDGTKKATIVHASQKSLTDVSATVDGNGHAFVIWVEDGSRVFVSRFDAATVQWNQAEELVRRSGFTVRGPKVAMAEDGRASAVWSYIKGKESWLALSWYDPTADFAAWSAWIELPNTLNDEEFIEPDDFAVVMPPDPPKSKGVKRTAIGIIRKTDGMNSRRQVWGLQHSNGKWSGKSLTDELTTLPTGLRIVATPDGRTLVFWRQFESNKIGVRCRMLQADGTWTESSTKIDGGEDTPWLPDTPGGAAADPQVLWVQRGRSDELEHRRFVRTAQWPDVFSKPQCLDVSGGCSQTPTSAPQRHAIDLLTNGFAIWTQASCSGSEIRLRRRAGGAWSQSQNVRSINGRFADDPLLATSGSGVGAIYWIETLNRRNHLFVRVFD